MRFAILPVVLVAGILQPVAHAARVLLPDGAPAAGARAIPLASTHFLRIDGLEILNLVEKDILLLNEDGTLEITEKNAGRWIILHPQGYADLPADVDTETIRLEKWETLSGRVDSAGETDGRVSFARSERPRRRDDKGGSIYWTTGTEIAEDGSFTIPHVPRGFGQVGLMREYRHERRITNWRDYPQAVTVPQTEAVVLGGGIAVRGRVDLPSEHLPAVLSIAPRAARPPYYGVTDSAENFQIPGLLPGNYRLTARGNLGQSTAQVIEVDFTISEEQTEADLGTLRPNAPPFALEIDRRVENKGFSSTSLRRIAVFGPPDEVVKLEAGLSRIPGVQVLERTNRKVLQEEQVFSAKALLPLALEQGLSADMFFLLEEADDSSGWTLILVDAQSGRELARAINLRPDDLLKKSIRLLMEYAPASLAACQTYGLGRAGGSCAGGQDDGEGASPLRAVTEPSTQPHGTTASSPLGCDRICRWPLRWLLASDKSPQQRALSRKSDRLLAPDKQVVVLESDHPEARAVGQSIREILTGHGIPVLDRSLTWQVLEERFSQKSGFLKAEDTLPAFAGANLLLAVDKQDSDAVEIKVISGDGSLLRIFNWKMSAANSDRLQQALLPLLIGAQESKVSPYQQRVGIEALLPFYRGVKAFSSGDPLKAMVEFQKAREANHRFVAAYQWEQRCYETLGLPEFSSALQRWLEIGLQGRGVAAGGVIIPRDGLTFLGVQSPTTQDRILASHWEKMALQHLAGPNLLLPESLVALGREMDFLAAATEGSNPNRKIPSPPEMGWSTSDGFTSRFTLRGAMQGGEIEWILSDDLSGKVVARRRMRADLSPEKAITELGDTLDILVQEKTEIEEAKLPMSVQLPDIEEALRTMKTSSDQTEKLAAGLALLLQQPNHPLAAGVRFGSPSGSSGLLGDYLDHAKRQLLLRRLPADDPQRAWIELQDIQMYLPAVACGRHLSGEERDGLADLKTFSEKTDGHPARLLARFFWLTDMQAVLPPEEVAREARQLAEKLSVATGVPRGQDLAAMAQSLEWLALAASGEPGMMLDPKQITPESFRMEITPEREIRLVGTEGWRVEEFRKLNLTPDEIVLEARAALAIGGRSARRKSVNPEWLTEFANSFSLVSWVGWICIHEFSHKDGLPHAHTGNYPAWKAHSRKMIQVAVEGLSSWLNRVENEEQFRLVDAPIHWLVPAMGAPAYNLSNEEFAAFHRQLAEASARAATRLGVKDRTPRRQGLYQMDWRDITLEEIHKQGADDLNGPPNFMRDIPAFARALREFAHEAFVAEIPSIRNWWEQSNWGLDGSMSNREFATQFIMPFYSDILRTYGEGSLSDDDRALVLDLGILLMWGWRYAEAEPLFELVASAPPGPTSIDGIRRALQASALFHLARLQIQARNKPSAIRLLQEVLDKTADLEVRLLGRMHRNFRHDLLSSPGQRENLRSLAIRLLEELRFNPRTAKLPERTFALQIPTTQLENSEVTVFYRLPSNLTATSPILILLPAFNDGGLELLGEGSYWIPFADAHNLILVVPQFFQNHTVWKADHPCAPYHFPQLWSGKGLLEAIAQIRSRHSVGPGKLHFHGRGAGAQCAARFARWKPDLVGSLSLHTGASFPWKEREIGLHAPEAYKGMPVLLTVGTNEDHGISSDNRRYNAEIFHTVLKGAGADVEFHLLDSTFHRSSQREESLSKNFLSNHLHTILGAGSKHR